MTTPELLPALAEEMRAATPEQRVRIARETSERAAALLRAIDLDEIDSTPAEKSRLQGIELAMRLIGVPWP